MIRAGCVRRMGRLRGRNGFVLGLVLFAMAVVSALLGATLFAGIWGVRSARAGVDFEGTNAASYADLLDAIRRNDIAVLTTVPVGSTLTLAAPSGVAVRRLNAHSFLATWSAARFGSGSARGTAVLARIVPPPFVLDRPLSTPGAVQLGANALLTGPAFATPQIDCHEPAGSPFVATPFAVGSYEDRAVWSSLATKTIAPAAPPLTIRPSHSSNQCFRADPMNWGDPRHATADCGWYWPVVHALGDLTLTGGVGQGVLVVDGDLVLSGGVEFHGLVIVGGRLATLGLGATVVGAVQVDDGQNVGSTLNGTTTIAYSRCALGRALLPHGRLEPLPERAWIQAF